MIVKEHAELEKAKKSVDILQRGLLNISKRKINLQGTNNVQGQIFQYTFKNQNGAIVFNILQIIFQNLKLGKKITRIFLQS